MRFACVVRHKEWNLRNDRERGGPHRRATCCGPGRFVRFEIPRGKGGAGGRRQNPGSVTARPILGNTKKREDAEGG